MGEDLGTELWASEQPKSTAFEARRTRFEARESAVAETRRNGHEAPSDQGPVSTPPPIALIGRIVPEPASAWDDHVRRRNRGECVTAAANRRRRRPHANIVAGALVVLFGPGWVGGWHSSPLVNFLNQPARGDMACSADEGPSTELAEARAYLVQAATPSYTMVQQGPELAIERLHPKFAIRLAKAVREARDSGLSSVGIYSAYRPPAFGVGRFSDKFNSLHAYGLAADLSGIGRPGSGEAQRWHEIAASHGVICPYGPDHKSEWNHCQPSGLKIVSAGNLLRETITADGPVSLEAMFEAGNSIVESLANTTDNKRQVQAALNVQASRSCPTPSQLLVLRESQDIREFQGMA